MKPLVIIPARGGSKGVPGKNIKKLGGKPLIYYTIEAAREVFNDQEIIVTTDDEKIKKTAERTGLHVPFLRPEELATDEVGTYDVLLHALKFVESTGYFPDTMILLQPTSPFRTSQHIREALALYNPQLDMVVSVKETKSNPYYTLFEETKEGYLVKSKNGNYLTRQECPKVWEYNGAIYLINVSSLKKTHINKFRQVKKFVMEEIASHDIDTVLDWKIGEWIIKLNNDKITDF